MSELENVSLIGDQILTYLTERKVIEGIPLNLQQAALYLGRSTRTVSNYVRRGILKKKVQNGLVGYLIDDLNKLKK